MSTCPTVLSVLMLVMLDENVALIAELSAAERTRIARACYETALMLFSPPPGGYISDEELQEILEPLKVC